MIADCKEAKEDVEKGTGICFKWENIMTHEKFVLTVTKKTKFIMFFRCGSTEHSVRNCLSKVQGKQNSCWQNRQLLDSMLMRSFSTVFYATFQFVQLQFQLFDFFCTILGYPYAKCFICNRTGHLSRDCEENLKGVYPKGKITSFLSIVAIVWFFQQLSQKADNFV